VAEGRRPAEAAQRQLSDVKLTPDRLGQVCIGQPPVGNPNPRAALDPRRYYWSHYSVPENRP